LHLDGGSHADADAATLVASRFLAGLTELSLGGTNLGPAGLRALAASPHLSNLTALNLASNPALAEGPDELRRLTGREGLTDLNLGSTGMRPLHVGALFGGRSAARLRRLNLNYNPVGSAGARVLGDAPSLRGLTEVYLASCQLRVAGVHALTESP